ncbi:MAG: hypothetical protein LIO79_07740 [Rikenellaceae bacterium]|nr:hypothetical protein [Rikenellaceae bacterium]
MKGIQVKEKLLKNGYVLADVAKNMGIIPQNLQSLLAAEDIKTGVLETIAKAISKSVYFFYEDTNEEIVEEKRPNEDVGKLIDVIHNQSSQLNESQKQISKSQEQIDRLLSLLEVANQKGVAEGVKGVAPKAAHG